ncbi:ras-related protein Rab-43-like [Convolutriloba macropyga]|uniref:ras-related protein Rab-43-like n=1 Tax=Convolutriloba macropyga TaxID=536237 RepID=UPI003F52199B
MKLDVPMDMNDEQDDNYDFLFKVVLIGDTGVGKTCVVQQFKSNTFIERYASTIGVDFTMKTVAIDDKKVKLQIWDTAGQERFRTITQSYYRCANCVIVVYDVTRRETFMSLQHWLEDVDRYSGDNVLRVLIGNKCDTGEQREVSTTEAEDYHSAFQFAQFMETSAKDGTNIHELFMGIARQLKDSVQPNANNIGDSSGQRIDPSKPISTSSSTSGGASFCSCSS